MPSRRDTEKKHKAVHIVYHGVLSWNPFRVKAFSNPTSGNVPADRPQLSLSPENALGQRELFPSSSLPLPLHPPSNGKADIGNKALALASGRGISGSQI